MREGKLPKRKRTAKSQKVSGIMDKKMTYAESLQIAIETINAIDLFDSFEDVQIGRIEKARDRLIELKASIEKRNASKSTGTAKEGTKAAKDDAEKAAFRDAVAIRLCVRARLPSSSVSPLRRLPRLCVSWSSWVSSRRTWVRRACPCSPASASRANL